MDCSLSGSSVHGIFQARVLEWIAISFSRGSSQPRNWTQVSHIAGRRFTIWATREALSNLYTYIFKTKLTDQHVYGHLIYYKGATVNKGERWSFFFHFIYSFFFFATLHSMWNFSYSTRNRTHTLRIGSTEFQPLDHQGSPRDDLFNKWC